MYVLLIEDNPAEARLTREAFREANFAHELQIMQDGEAAVSFLQRKSTPKPGVILMDLHLSHRPGCELLREIKSDPELCTIPVIVVSNSAAPSDVEEVYRQRGNCYLVKPTDLDDYFTMLRRTVDFWFSTASLPVSASECVAVEDSLA